MKEDALRFARLGDAVYSGRMSLGFSVQNDVGGYDAFDGDARPLGSFSSRAEARLAIVRAADAQNGGECS
jgi:hypothetical protein